MYTTVAQAWVSAGLRGGRALGVQIRHIWQVSASRRSARPAMQSLIKHYLALLLLRYYNAMSNHTAPQALCLVAASVPTSSFSIDFVMATDGVYLVSCPPTR